MTHPPAPMAEAARRAAGLHHVELWVPDLAGALPAWPDHYAAYLEDAYGYEVELVAAAED